MANKKFSELPAGSPLTGSEIIPMVQDGETVITTAQEIADLAELGFTPENSANKATDFLTVNDTKYPSVQASKTYTDNTAIAMAIALG